MVTLTESTKKGGYELWPVQWTNKFGSSQLSTQKRELHSDALRILHSRRTACCLLTRVNGAAKTTAFIIVNVPHGTKNKFWKTLIFEIHIMTCRYNAISTATQYSLFFTQFRYLRQSFEMDEYGVLLAADKEVGGNFNILLTGRLEQTHRVNVLKFIYARSLSWVSNTSFMNLRLSNQSKISLEISSFGRSFPIIITLGSKSEVYADELNAICYAKWWKMVMWDFSTHSNQSDTSKGYEKFCIIHFSWVSAKISNRFSRKSLHRQRTVSALHWIKTSF